MNDRPTTRPYARIERERRFLLERLPPALDPDDYERLDDLFVEGTHLRLRHVRRPNGEWIITKLGQKILDPAAPNDPRCRQMTTIYLPEQEAAALASLGGLRTTKRRYKLPEQGWTFCIDVWESPEPARGTILAEVEAPSIEELERVTLPTWALREVTEDARFSAITLAGRATLPSMSVSRAHFIFYVRDQAASSAFFRRVLLAEPTLDVPGMTEFALPGGAVLGLMPERGIVALLGAQIDPSRANGAPRAELYLLVDDLDAYHARALAAGARELSGAADRDWNHRVAYSADPDGHVLAFASELLA